MMPTEHEMTAALTAAAKARVAHVVGSQQDRTLTPDEADVAYRAIGKHAQYRVKNELIDLVVAALDAFAPLHEQRVRADAATPVIAEAEQSTEYGRS